jgi:hypothetical protein
VKLGILVQLGQLVLQGLRVYLVQLEPLAQLEPLVILVLLDPLVNLVLPVLVFLQVVT